MAVHTYNFLIIFFRSCISTMLDSNFTSEHLQPLIELSITIRLKCLSNVIEKTSEGLFTHLLLQ